jgi:hypothetical protein
MNTIHGVENILQSTVNGRVGHEMVASNVQSYQPIGYPIFSAVSGKLDTQMCIQGVKSQNVI